MAQQEMAEDVREPAVHYMMSAYTKWWNFDRKRPSVSLNLRFRMADAPRRKRRSELLANRKSYTMRHGASLDSWLSCIPDRRRQG